MDLDLKQRDNGVWTVVWYDADGKRQRKSTGTRDYKEALSKAPAIAAGKTPGRADFFTVGQALDLAWRNAWQHSKSADKKLYEVDAVRRYWGEEPVGAVTTAKAKEWVGAMRAAKLGAVTINNRVSTLSVALKEAVDEGKLDNVPHLPRAQQKPHKTRWVTEEEELKLKREALTLNETLPGFPGAGDVMVRVIEALTRTGMRLSELLLALPEHVIEDPEDEDGGAYLHLADQKGGKEGVVVLTAEALDALRFLWDHATWHRVTADLWAGREINRTRLATARDWAVKRFTTIRNRAGLRDVSLHKLRHTYATRLVQNGADLYAVQGLLRHSGPQVTQRYAHLTPKHLRDTLKKHTKKSRKEGGEVVPLRRSGT